MNVLADIGEGDDLIALRGDFGGSASEQRGSEIDIVEPRILGMEARPQLQQRADPSTHGNGAARGRDDVGDDLEQRRFTRAILADDSERFARGQLKGYVVKRAKHV